MTHTNLINDNAGFTPIYKAYCLVGMDPVTMRVVSVGIYSDNERSITCYGRMRYARLFEQTGSSYQEAHDKAVEQLNCGFYSQFARMYSKKGN